MAVAVAFSMAWAEGGAEGGTSPGAAGGDQALGRLAGLRHELFQCLGRRADALWELAEAVLSLEPECRRGHGAVYDALNCGEVRIGRLRRALAALPLPAWNDARIRLAADVGNWLRPDAEASPERLFCRCYARGKGNKQLIPGWPYSFVA